MKLRQFVEILTIHSWIEKDHQRMVCSVCGRRLFREDYYDDWGPAPWETIYPGDALKHWKSKTNK
ncbi:MAG: hypothetical protein V4633_17105 [Pseudomonadota bacterium]